MEKREEWTGILLVFLAGCIWGSIGFFVNTLTGYGVRTEMIPFARIGFAAMFLLPFCIIKGKGLRLLRIDRGGLAWSAAMGLFTQALFNLCYTLAIRHTNVSTGAILLYTAPAFVLIMSRIFYRERITSGKAVALILNIIGCVLTVTGGAFGSLQVSTFGVLMGVGAGFFYGLLTILSKAATRGRDPLTIGFYAFCFGTLFLFLFARPWQGLGNTASKEVVLIFAVGYGLATAFAYMSYLNGVGLVREASRVPVIDSIETVVAALFGFLLYHEAAGLVKFFGIALVMISIAVMNLWKEKKTLASGER